ncbi:MAG: demethoxyubiquinone hydroxylase family protein [Alphaproteobacteria bacterium]|nr:demethoxyubiquinone hydroxylase family protein [Alphaproteobacteria bacterium]
MTDRHATLPGDPTPTERLAEVLRVDHAGEYGAVRIYDGQLAVLGDGPAGDSIRRMRDQERQHLQAFDRLLPAHRVRPTLLTPLWHVAGFALGAATAALGDRAAMACTVAIEEVIDEHYAGQVAELAESRPELAAQLERFRREEIEHRDHALAAGAVEAPGHAVLTTAIKAGSRLAIWLSTRI